MTGADTDGIVLSVISPTFNEGRHVERLLDSLAGQDLDDRYEILIVDGRSTDDTRARIASWVARTRPGPAVRVIDNELRRTPFAFNLGLREARGTYVAILGAHARYDRTYLRACLEEVRGASTPTACGGIVRTVPADGSLAARLVVSVLMNPFASSSRSFRTVKAGPVDSISYPVAARETLLAVGGYDERLARNQDNDMNERLVRHGVSLRITDATGVDYVAVADPAKLMRYAWRNGWWSARSAMLASTRMHARYFVPAAFVTGIGAAATAAVLAPHQVLQRLGRVALAGALVAHLGLGSRAVARSHDGLRTKEAALVPPLIVAFHAAYGAGTIASFVAAGTARRRARG